MTTSGAAQLTIDQYEGGFMPDIWDRHADENTRTIHYGNVLNNILKKKNCETILDLACGTGGDSILLLEQGFEVTSIDRSPKMLKYTLEKKMKRMNEETFKKWVLKQANWLTLSDDIGKTMKYDAMICLGNSFPMLHSAAEHKKALSNFYQHLNPGGILIIDHRNFDHIIDTGLTPQSDIYYPDYGMFEDVIRTILYKNGKPHLMQSYYKRSVSFSKENEDSSFSTYVYPFRLSEFSGLLKEVFKINDDKGYKVYGDFKSLKEVNIPGFYIHVIEKPTL